MKSQSNAVMYLTIHLYINLWTGPIAKWMMRTAIRNMLQNSLSHAEMINTITNNCSRQIFPPFLRQFCILWIFDKQIPAVDRVYIRQGLQAISEITIEGIYFISRKNRIWIKKWLQGTNCFHRRISASGLVTCFSHFLCVDN